MSSEARKEVERFLLEGKKIAAIRYLADTYDFSLQESTLLVDALEKELQPDRDNADTSPGNLHVHERFSASLDTGSHSRTPEIILYVFAGIGLLFVGVAALIYYQQSRSIQKSDPAKGKVVRLESGNDSGSAPVIEYEWRGNTWVYISSTYSSPSAYSIGEVVPIYVSRDDPKNIIIDTFIDRYFLITIFGGMGFLFVAIAYGVMLINKPPAFAP